MSGVRVIVVVIAALIVPCAAADAAYIEFQPVQTYIIPGAGSIQYARFNDLDLDHSPEVLAIGTDRTTLYSPRMDSVLYSIAIGTNNAVQAVFDDVNRDNVPDIVAGTTEGSEFPNARITVADGLSIWLGIPRTETREFSIARVAIWPSGTLGFLKAFDINLDGKNELAFSYDSAYCPVYYHYEFTGMTRCYYSFPDSLLWARPQMFLGIWPLNGSKWLTAINYGYLDEYPLLTIYAFAINLGIYDSFDDSESRDLVQGPTVDLKQASGEMGTVAATYPKCVGNLVSAIPGTEILASYSYSSTNTMSDQGNYSITQLRMYNYIAPDSLDPVWQLDGVSIPQNVLAQGGFSGHYLGFQGNTLNLYEGASGSVSYSTTDVPAGRRQWCYPFNDSLPYLAVMNADTVALYSLAVSTAVDDGGEGTPIPSVLAIGAPRPNPFNAAQMIPLKARPGQYLTVDIFNLLGQKVARIFDGRVTTAEFDIPWKANQLPSGIYFIRATSGDEAVTMKSILIK